MSSTVHNMYRTYSYEYLVGRKTRVIRTVVEESFKNDGIFLFQSILAFTWVLFPPSSPYH